MLDNSADSVAISEGSMDFGDIFGGFTKLAGMGLDWYRGDKAARAADDRYRTQLQREDTAIQRKVADAKAAGIHPIYALGGSGAASGPYAEVGQPAQIGEQLGSGGQSIGKAISAYANREERTLLLEGTRLDVEKKRLDNQISKMELASRIAQITQGSNPPFPNVVAPNSPKTTIELMPKEKPREYVKDTKRTGTSWFGHDAPIADIPDAQTMQNRYGEPAEWLYFPFVAAADAMVAAWPHISRFADWTGLGIPNPAGYGAMMNKLDKYMKLVGTNWSMPGHEDVMSRRVLEKLRGKYRRY